MKKSLTALAGVEGSLSALRRQRPNELDSSPGGFEGVNYDSLESLFLDWRSWLETLARTRWADTAAANLSDAVIARQLTNLTTSLTNALNHGAVWLLVSSGFSEGVMDIGQRISFLAERRAGLAKNLAKELSKQTVENAAAIMEAAPVALDLGAKAQDAEAVLRELTSKSTETKDILQKLTEASANLGTLQAEITAAHSAITETKAETSRFHEEIAGYRATAESKAGELEKRIVELNGQAKDSEVIIKEANEHLREALADVRRKGLAEAFADRGRRILHERSIWLFVFVCAAGGLVLTAQTFVSEINAFTYEALAIAFLRRAALAAPLVWLGWYAAKQIGRLNRVHEDYEYKAATALAFESYRNEIASSGDNSLMGDLLKSTITNFGDNPVRLYDNLAKEPATPAEELAKKLDEDGTFKLLTKLQSLLPGR